jgi:hypothetical protein
MTDPRDRRRRAQITWGTEIEPEGPSFGDWDRWYLDPRSLSLIIKLFSDTSSYTYEVDLETCVTSAEVLDWICQISGKEWSTAAVLAGLVYALDDVLKPQAHLCSDGRHKRMATSKIAELVATAAKNGAPQWPDMP